MPTLIIDGNIEDSAFVTVEAEAADLSASNVLLPMATWLENRDALAGRNDVGVWLGPDDEVEKIADAVSTFPVIALNFPAFVDGRCLSTANMLRRRYGYTGELRAFGDVRRDQVEQMRRCGINAFHMADGQDLEATIGAMTQFSHGYQATIDNPEPLFRNRQG